MVSAVEGGRLADGVAVDSFTEFVLEVEPRLKRALVAAFGRDAGMDAVAEALAYGWENWDRVQMMDNPAGYLWTVGRNRARTRRRSRPVFPPMPSSGEPWVEPGLPDAMAALSEAQRTAVVLLHGFGWTAREVAELVGSSESSVRTHAVRGMAKLRRKLGTDR
ncbi:MAG: sigma-70 family RNA polymerase sigma factor [Acidimicrobiia bacterium]|nr:sigma-70 family RNA polymerase sigma factor [Acidimicrobiia bacterium]